MKRTEFYFRCEPHWLILHLSFAYPSLNLRSRFAQDSVRVGGKNSEKKTLANSESLPKCVVLCAIL